METSTKHIGGKNYLKLIDKNDATLLGNSKYSAHKKCLLLLFVLTIFAFIPFIRFYLVEKNKAERVSSNELFEFIYYICGNSSYAPTKADKHGNLEILNGDVVNDPTLLPWMTAVFYRGRQSCSGTIITDHHILTAAHCLDDFYHDNKIGNYTGPWPPALTNQFNVSVGATNLTKIAEGVGKLVRSKKIYPHPNHTYMNFWVISADLADIAVIELEEKLNLSMTVRPICVSSRTELAPETPAIISGWGLTDIHQREENTTILHAGWNQIKSADVCIRFMPKFLPSKAWCAFGSKTNICHGDSGGPIALKIGNVHLQIGIAAGNLGDWICKKPYIFTKTGHYCEWLQSITGIKCI